jgi:hypothetical protein
MHRWQTRSLSVLGTLVSSEVSTVTEGRDAYFADPEGNYWEIAWAPPDNPVVAAARRAAGVAPDEGTGS